MNESPVDPQSAQISVFERDLVLDILLFVLNNYLINFNISLL